MQNVLENICYILISGCGIAFAKHICTLINKKIDEYQINSEIKKYERLNLYVDSAQEAISNAVLTVTQTYVENLKKNGSFTKEAQIEAKEQALKIANHMITEDCKKAIVAVYGDFNVYLDSVIESLVQLNK